MPACPEADGLQFPYPVLLKTVLSLFSWGKHYRTQVVSRQFTDRFFDHFTDRALGIRAEDDNLLLFLSLDIDPSPRPKFVPSPCPIFIT